MHTHIVDEALLVFDPALVALGHLACHFKKQTVGTFHDVGFRNSRDFAALVLDGVLESKADNSLGIERGNRFYGNRGLRIDFSLSHLDDFFGFFGSRRPLHARVEIFHVFADDD